LIVLSDCKPHGEKIIDVTHQRVNVLLTWIKLPRGPDGHPLLRGERHEIQELAMLIKKVAVATTAVFITTSPLAYAAETSSNTVGMTHPSAADLNSLTDARVAMIKAALQLTPDQQKYWPAVEDAIRARAKSRQARLERVAELRDSGPMEALHEHNPVELMQRRAESLSQRAADLKKVADAWEPLYKTLSQDQKKRMAFVTVVVARGIRDAIERRIESEDDDE
jgi:hypothetical protein